MSNSRIGLLASMAMVMGAAIPIEGPAKQAEPWHMPYARKGGYGSVSGGRRGVSRRELRKRYGAQEGRPGKYVLIAGQVRNTKKLFGRC